jgi:hypothetical protein
MSSELNIQTIKSIPTPIGVLTPQLVYVIANTPDGQTIETIGSARFSEQKATDNAVENAYQAASITDANVRLNQLDTFSATIRFKQGGYKSTSREGTIPQINLSLSGPNGSTNSQKRLSFVLTVSRVALGLSIIGIPLLWFLPSPNMIRSRAYRGAIKDADSRLYRLS